MTLTTQVIELLLIALPVACIAWTVTHEELFKEPREYCVKQSKECASVWLRKFFYVFTCEYCFSHYVSLAFLMITKYHLIFNDWRGYLIGGFALVWIANVYMSLFGLIRVDMKKEKMDADIEELRLKEEKRRIE
jgi:hypothetical protein